MYRSPPATPTPAPRRGMTGPARTSTGTRTTSLPPTWPRAHDTSMSICTRTHWHTDERAFDPMREPSLRVLHGHPCRTWGGTHSVNADSTSQPAHLCGVLHRAAPTEPLWTGEESHDDGQLHPRTGCGIIGTGCPQGCPGPPGLGRGICLSSAGGLQVQLPVFHRCDKRGKLLRGHGQDGPLPAVCVLLGVLHAGPSPSVTDSDARLCPAGSAGLAVMRGPQCLEA